MHRIVDRMKEKEEQPLSLLMFCMKYSSVQIVEIKVIPVI
jgi:hypothetical protein